MLTRNDITAHVRRLTDRQLGTVREVVRYGANPRGPREARLSLPRRGISPQLVVAAYCRTTDVLDAAENEYTLRRRAADLDTIAERVTKFDTQRAYSALRQLRPSFSGTIKAAIAKRAERRAAATLAPVEPLARRVKLARVIVPLGWRHGDTASADASQAEPRFRNWERPEAVATWRHGVRIRHNNEGRYSSNCTYIHWTYTPEIGSFARITRAGMVYVFRGKSYTFRHPHGYRWSRDSNGLRLYSLADPRNDYHPDSGDLLPNGKQATLRSLSAVVRGNAEARRAVARGERRAIASSKRAEGEGCRVCLADSLRAGTCCIGTREWARRHGLDATRHYRPSEVLALANGDSHRVALVVTVALKRHREEMAAGACVVADHRA